MLDLVPKELSLRKIELPSLPHDVELLLGSQCLSPHPFIVMMVITFALLVPQFYVLLQPTTARWCEQPLLQILIVSIIFTFISIGFTFLFMLMIPVPRELKIVFHIFGIMCFVEGLVAVVYTSQAGNCKSTTEELYYISLAIAWFTCVSIIFFAIMIPFWIINKVKRNSMVDRRSRQGVCYEPVKCCTCLWHI
ncbi:hypothetical protein KP79_PYT21246 [Mizuhopecten yessoensis]|uniref:MARVEL domain-containing protein n=1 Tax=Mizuhopecten yessoensis TaxID=6573 RepID=A0A210QTJ0_MIZYE|nr:hypothetical protein KP79_PYT21246 [Mizuhopecten yessoensis]